MASVLTYHVEFFYTFYSRNKYMYREYYSTLHTLFLQLGVWWAYINSEKKKKKKKSEGKLQICPRVLWKSSSRKAVHLKAQLKCLYANACSMGNKQGE